MYPSILMFHGGRLERPVHLADSWAIAEFLQRDMHPVSQGYRQGTRLLANLSAFWGAEWSAYISAGKPVTELLPNEANQHARVYSLPDGSVTFSFTREPDRPGIRLPFPTKESDFVRTMVVSQTGLNLLKSVGVPLK